MTACHCRGAGVTMAENARYLAALRKLVSGARLCRHLCGRLLAWAALVGRGYFKFGVQPALFALVLRNMHCSSPRHEHASGHVPCRALAPPAPPASMIDPQLDRPENRTCADCKDGSAGSRPSWASINTGVFVCSESARPPEPPQPPPPTPPPCLAASWLPSSALQGRRALRPAGYSPR